MNEFNNKIIFIFLTVLFVIVVCIFFTGCSYAPVRIIDITCEELEPIIISKDDVLTDETARQIYIQDIYLQDKCNLKKSNIGHG